MIDTANRISIQVGLSGYSFKIQAEGNSHSSEWLSAERIFNTSEFMRRYGQVDVSVFTPKFALVPNCFHAPDVSRQMLEEVANVEEGDHVDHVEVPQFGAVLVYSLNVGGTLAKVVYETVIKTDGTKGRMLPEIYYMMDAMSEISDYNKIVASYMDGCLYLAIAQGKTLLLCNSFQAPDFTTAEYFIFLVMKKLQLNPEISSIYFRTSLSEDQEMSLYRYFRSVEHL
jgi:hypothetical protein